jgi:hypothetical protein
MADYQLADHGVIRSADGLHITNDMIEWLDYVDWYKSGGQPDPMPVVETPRWPNLDAGKAEVHALVNNIRDNREASGFQYQGHPVDSDSRSVQRINTAVQAAQVAIAMGQPFGLDWACQDNSIITLDAAGMMGMPVALAIHANALHQHSRSLKVAIDAATSIPELEAIDIETGWPT